VLRLTITVLTFNLSQCIFSLAKTNDRIPSSSFSADEA